MIQISSKYSLSNPPAGLGGPGIVKWPRVSLHSAQFLSNRWGPPQLIAFLAFIRTTHHWTETHPELEYELDMTLNDEGARPVGSAVAQSVGG